MTIQQRLSESNEGRARRKAAFDVMDVRIGQRILDLGCGGGFFVRELAMSVGKEGMVVALDSSSVQIDVAKKTCADLPNVEYFTCSATKLPFPDASFDSIISTQTLEYIPDVDAALQECRRVIKPGGRLAAISVMWDHFKIHGCDEELTPKIFEVFKGHCAHQNLPVEMPAKLGNLSFIGIQQTPLAFFINSYHANSFGFYASKAVRGFAKSSGQFTEAELNKWDTSLVKAVANNRFAFCSFPVLTSAVLSMGPLRMPVALSASPPPSAPESEDSLLLQEDMPPARNVKIDKPNCSFM